MNSKERAVALQYQDSAELPKVLTSAKGEAAKRLVEIALNNDIPVEKNDVLAEMLSEIPSGNSISPESFRLVAEIICFLYFADKEWRERHAELDSLMVSGD